MPPTKPTHYYIVVNNDKIVNHYRTTAETPAPTHAGIPCEVTQFEYELADIAAKHFGGNPAIVREKAEGIEAYIYTLCRLK